MFVSFHFRFLNFKVKLIKTHYSWLIHPKKISYSTDKKKNQLDDRKPNFNKKNI